MKHRTPLSLSGVYQGMTEWHEIELEYVKLNFKMKRRIEYHNGPYCKACHWLMSKENPFKFYEEKTF